MASAAIVTEAHTTTTAAGVAEGDDNDQQVLEAEEASGLSREDMGHLLKVSDMRSLPLHIYLYALKLCLLYMFVCDMYVATLKRQDSSGIFRA